MSSTASARRGRSGEPSAARFRALFLGQEKLGETLREAQQLVTSLLEEKEIAPGVLRRDAAAPTDQPPEPRVPRSSGRA